MPSGHSPVLILSAVPVLGTAIRVLKEFFFLLHLFTKSLMESSATQHSLLTSSHIKLPPLYLCRRTPQKSSSAIFNIHACAFPGRNLSYYLVQVPRNLV